MQGVWDRYVQHTDRPERTDSMYCLWYRYIQPFDRIIACDGLLGVSYRQVSDRHGTGCLH